MSNTLREDGYPAPAQPFPGNRIWALSGQLVTLLQSFPRHLATWWRSTNRFFGITIYQDNPRAVRISAPAEIDTPDTSHNTLHRKRLEAIQMIWGEGFLEPGGETAALNLLATANVKPNHTILDLTAGLGGTAVAAAARRKLWIEALEPDAQFAELAARHVQTCKLGERIHVTVADFDNLQLPERRYDLIYSRERLFTIANKAGVFQAVSNGLKNKGTLIVTDFVVKEDAGHAGALEKWAMAEWRKPSCWTRDTYLKTFQEFDLTIRYDEDMTDEYLKLIHDGWRRILLCIEGKKADRQFTDYLLREGETWLARAEAMKCGALSLHKIHAVRAGRKTAKSGITANISDFLKPSRSRRA